MEVNFFLSHSSDNLSVIFKYTILTEAVVMVIKYLSPVPRGPLILPVDPTKALQTFQILNLHRTGFYCHLLVKLYTIFLWYKLNPGSRMHYFKLKGEEESPSLNALLTTIPWQLAAQILEGKKINQLKTKPSTPNMQQQELVELFGFFLSGLFFPFIEISWDAGVQHFHADPGEPGWFCAQLLLATVPVAFCCFQRQKCWAFNPTIIALRKPRLVNIWIWRSALTQY